MKNICYQDTIFALSTVPGKSGVAIIRISGSSATDIYKIFSINKTIKPRYAEYNALYEPDSNDILDYALILYFKAPYSFTGEDIVELHLHGSRAVINSVVTILSKQPNYRLAEPGEFSKRAFINGKMDLTEAEGLADLIDSETILQQKQALKQLNGGLSNLYETWRKELIHILAYIEAYIDFPEEDLPNHVIDEICRDVEEVQNSIKKHLADNRRGERLREGIYITIIGAPNVGKSSLLNYLAKRDVAIVSDEAGTTRDVLEVHLDIDGFPITIADTAGIRESSNNIENEGIKRALNKAEEADLKLIVISNDTENTEKSIELIDERSILIVNKSDLGDLPNLKHDYITISVKTGDGLEELLAKISNYVQNYFFPLEDPMITRERHRKALEDSLKALYDFSLNKPIELASEDIRIASRSLGKITGKVEVEVILDEIFSSFCIGK